MVQRNDRMDCPKDNDLLKTTDKATAACIQFLLQTGSLKMETEEDI